ncbi:alpha/beta fold hydrolase [Flavobacterium sp. '19STA2R22 D10 B1']|uniref:alpha/beta fold hydrolase n=1 Tax=Flavobacterium aerium TaxID=3037261 RepID=UPI00278C85A5|nr:alpha/beta hydrolase [Flavobacterium sp. '19STA2R22 D10 B1']
MKTLTNLKITLVILLLNFSNYTKAQTSNNPFEVKITGKGNQSIIFIPGFASSGAVWDETKSKLEKDYTCYTLTMAGFAGIPPQANASFKSWETAIANYIKANKIKKPIIIGHSMGGGFALALASDYPELIEKIIVVDALPCLPALMNPTFKAKEKNDCSSIVTQLTTITDEQFLQMQKATIPQLLADTTKQELVVNWGLKSDRKTFAEMYCDFSNTDLRESIQNIQCPALILLEANFKNIKTAIEDQYKNLKTAQLEYANKGLHFIMYDDPEWYDGQLNNFLKTK